MQIKNTQLIFFLLWINTFYVSAQQIQKGLIAINDGTAQLNRTAYNSTVFNYATFMLNGGGFVNDHLFLGGEAKFYQQGPSYWENFRNQKYSIYGQYYFNPQNRWVFFSELMAHYGLIDWLQLPNNSGNDVYHPRLWGLSVGLGFNRFLNKDVVFRGKLDFGNSQLLNDSKRNDYIKSLKLGISSFVNLNDTSSFSKGYTAKGRKLLNANLEIFGDRYIPNYEDFIRFHANFGTFITKGLLIGVSSDFTLNGDDGTLTLYFYTQYLQKIHNKLFAHVKVQTGATSLPDLGGFTYGGSAGFDYFLRPNMMIEANLVNYDKVYKDNGSYYNNYAFSYGPKISIRYFLR